jgi:glycosyltransferase involved in cell wall biosynthesis
MSNPKLAIFMSHPTQMEAPLFRKMTAHFDLKVFFWKTAVLDQMIDPELGHPPGWDFPLTEGYPNEVLPQNGSWLPDLEYSKVETYDAILVNGYGFKEALAAIFKALRKKIPVFLRSDTTLLQRRPVWKEGFRSIFLRSLFKKISAFMVTGSLAKHYLLHYQVPNEKIFLFPYAVDNELISDSCRKYRTRRDPLRNELGLPEGATVFLAIIKLIEREGGIDLLRAFEQVIKIAPNSVLIIVGDGSDRQKFVEHVQSKAIPNVLFAGYQPYSMLPKYFALADVFVHPARFEPWGVSVNEAMACGLPVIASDCVGASYDLVKEQENGFIYKAGDVNRLSEALTNFLNANKKQSMGDRSLQIINEWNYDLCIRELKKAIIQGQ